MPAEAEGHREDVPEYGLGLGLRLGLGLGLGLGFGFGLGLGFGQVGRTTWSAAGCSPT